MLSELVAQVAESIAFVPENWTRSLSTTFCSSTPAPPTHRGHEKAVGS
jgi:hypothetical protein